MRDFPVDRELHLGVSDEHEKKASVHIPASSHTRQVGTYIIKSPDFSMGRYDLRPLRVHQAATQLLNTERLSTVPPWYDIVGTIPPAQALVRTQPIQHHEQRKRTKVRKPSKMFQPQTIVYEEDTLRKEFFGDHPWELARPRVILENDGKDWERDDWSKIQQPGRQLNGERFVHFPLALPFSRVMILTHTLPTASSSANYGYKTTSKT